MWTRFRLARLWACDTWRTLSLISRVDLCACAARSAQQHVGEELEEIALAQPLPPALLLLRIGGNGGGIEMECPEAGIAVTGHVSPEVDAGEHAKAGCLLQPLARLAALSLRPPLL